MDIQEEWVIGYFLAINLLALIMFGLDKAWARGGGRRISEAGLFLVSLVGGVFGGMLGMILFRHKTGKAGFKVVMALILFINLCAIYFLYFNGWWFYR